VAKEEEITCCEQKEDDAHNLSNEAVNEEEIQQQQENPGPQEDPEQEEANGEEGPEAGRLSQLQESLDAVSAEKEEINQRYIRLQADFDNFRKRTRKEQQEFLQYACQSLIEKLLPILDNFERALESPDRESQAFKTGVEMIYKQLVGVLEQEGLSVIEAAAQPFDPQHHEAVMQEESDEYPDSTVIEVLQKGYKLKNKVIRPAMVKVAKN